MFTHLVGPFVVSLVLGSAAAPQHVHPAPTPAGSDTSQATAALSAQAVEELLAGAGMGLAKSAETNRYPGPKHLLERKQELGLSADQEQKIEAIRQQMLTTAKALGQQIIEAERALDGAFKAGTISESDLAERIRRIATLNGELRTAHLRAHIAAKPILSAEQVRKYYEPR